MKKKFKKGLLALLLAPTMLFAAACTRSISVSDYSDKMAASAENYYQTLMVDSRRTIEVSVTSENSYKQWVYWGEADENGSTEDFTSTSVVTQKFEIGKDTIGQESLRVTETNKTTINGFKEKEDETGYEAMTEVTDTKTITTYVMVPGENDEPTTCKAYVETSTKENNEEAVVVKEIYTYYGFEAFENSLKTINSSVENKLVENNFFVGTSFALFGLVGGEVEYYKDGKDAFGVKGNLATTEVNDGEVERQSTDFEIRYEKNLPVSVNMTGEYQAKNSHLDIEDQPTKMNMETESTGYITITYSCDAITVPTGFEDATTIYSTPSISVMSLSVSSVL